MGISGHSWDFSFQLFEEQPEPHYDSCGFSSTVMTNTNRSSPRSPPSRCQLSNCLLTKAWIYFGAVCVLCWVVWCGVVCCFAWLLPPCFVVYFSVGSLRMILFFRFFDWVSEDARPGEHCATGLVRHPPPFAYSPGDLCAPRCRLRGTSWVAFD